jgi:thiamine biosynthesis protein ThiS
MTVTIFVNGKRHETPAANVTTFVEELGLPPEMLLVEHNGTALHRSEWPTTKLGPDDRLEILKVAAGG